jgi:hypothetical protein
MLFGAPMGSRRYIFDDAYVYINTHHGWDLISITGLGGAFLIISNPGVDTTDYTTRKYYTLDGTEIKLKNLGDKPAGWTLLDDGQYGFEGTVSNNDPETNSYGYPSTDAGSLLVPDCGNGIPATMKLGAKNYRFVLNNAIEDEMWQGITESVQLPDLSIYSYNFLQLDDSLIYAPYKYKGNKPFISRYVKDGIVTAVQMWGSFLTVLVLNAYVSGEWFDNVPVVTRIYYKPFVQTSQNPRSYAAVTLKSACLTMANFYSDMRLKQDIIRGLDWVYTPSGVPQGGIPAGYEFPLGNNMLEPAKIETYDTKNNTKEVGIELDRGTDNVGYTSFFLDGDNISGKVFDSGTQRTTNTGLSTIQNDVKKPYAILEDGSMTYVRCQKDTEMDTWNIGLYVAGKLIEESGFLPVLKLYNDTIAPVLPAVAPEVGGCTMYVRPVNYRILQAHHEQGWDICVYRKTVFTDYTSQILPNILTLRSLSGHTYAQVRQTTINSVTTFWISVNGSKYPITYLDTNKVKQPYQSVNHENQITVLGEPYTGSLVGQQIITGGFYQDKPWVNIDAGSVNITRIFTSASSKHILVGLDVFPVTVNHITGLKTHKTWQNLEAWYDDSVYPWEPASDGVYEFTQDRKWLLFDSGGGLSADIKTPKFDSGGGIMKNVQRINTLCLLEE